MKYLIYLLLLCSRIYCIDVLKKKSNDQSTYMKNEINRGKELDSQPANVIMLFVDDLGYGDLGISGHPTSRTPNIDIMAQNGKFLTNFYVTSPVCSPSRSSLLTGRYQVRSGVYPGTFAPDSILGLPKNETTIANVLKNVGYNTEIIGKWHLGVGYNREFLPGEGSYGFDNYLGIPYSHDMCPCPICFPNNGSCLSGCWEGYVSCPLFNNKAIIEQPVYLPTLSERLLTRALQFIRKSNEERTPFFLYMAFHHVHHPQFASSSFVNKSDRGVMGDSLLELDWMVGEILSLLRELQIDNNTLSWFTSDNGPSLMRHVNGGCAGPLRCGKGTTWEGGVRVPAIVHWPGKIRPARSNALVSTLDILPTIAQIVGAQVGNLTLDGVDVSAVLLDDAKKSPRKFHALYPYSPNEDTGPLAVIYKQYKAHFYTKGSAISDNYNYDPMCRESHRLTPHDPPLLFDLYEDPGERYNLGNSTKYSSILKTIKEWRSQHMAEMQWMKPLTQITDKRSEPCCSKPTCEPFPDCCDCSSESRDNPSETDNSDWKTIVSNLFKKKF